MKGSKKMLVIIVIVLTGIVMAVGVGVKEKKESKKQTDASVSDLLYRKEQNAKEFALTKDYQEVFEDADFISVEKADRTTVEVTDGNSTTTYQTYIVSDLNLKEQKEKTEDYMLALASKEMDDSFVRKVSFEDSFGFSFKKRNGYEIWKKLLELNGFDGNLYKTNYDEETYELTKQHLFWLKDNCSVTKRMLENVSYEEVLDEKVSLRTIQTEDEIVIPDCLMAMIQYRMGEERYTKTMFLQVSINDLEETEEFYAKE